MLHRHYIQRARQVTRCRIVQIARADLVQILIRYKFLSVDDGFEKEFETNKDKIILSQKNGTVTLKHGKEIIRKC
jgi:hypothetical protein